MEPHLFLLSPGIWIGEGRILFSSSPDLIRYYTRWTTEPVQEGIIVSRQVVEIQGADEKVLNTFTLSKVTPTGFRLRLENHLVGSIDGIGIIDEKSIAWEFRGHSSFEGFEVYRITDGGDYMIHAEYASLDSHRTTIDGRVWKKSL